MHGFVQWVYKSCGSDLVYYNEVSSFYWITFSLNYECLYSRILHINNKNIVFIDMLYLLFILTLIKCVDGYGVWSDMTMIGYDIKFGFEEF